DEPPVLRSMAAASTRGAGTSGGGRSGADGVAKSAAHLLSRRRRCDQSHLLGRTDQSLVLRSMAAASGCGAGTSGGGRSGADGVAKSAAHLLSRRRRCDQSHLLGCTDQSLVL